MPINLSFQPAAAAVGGAALMGGNADFNRWRAQMLSQQWAMSVGAAQNAQQMNMSRLNALSQLAGQQQQQQSQQQFDQQMLPQRAAIEAQSQAFQSGLQGQNQQNLALLQGSLHAQQSTQDFGEQQAIAQYQDQLKQGMQDRALFQNPLQQHMQLMEQAQKSGYSFTPEQQQQVEQLKSDIGKIQASAADGTGSMTMGDAMPAMRQKVGQLNSITPSQPPPKTTDQVVSEKVTWGWVDPKTGKVKPGTENTPFTLDEKGQVMVPRGYKPPEPGEVDDNGELVPAKVAGQRIKNKQEQAKLRTQGLDWAHKQVALEEKSNIYFGHAPITEGPNAGMMTPIPGYRQQRIQELQNEYYAAHGGQPDIAPGEAPGEAAPQPARGGQPPPQAAPAGNPPPAGIPAPAQGAPQPAPAPQAIPGGNHFDPARGPVQGAVPSQGPAPGAFNHNPPPSAHPELDRVQQQQRMAQEVQQQEAALTPEVIQHRAIEHYAELSKALPPAFKAVEQKYAKEGRHSAAVAVAGLYGIIQHYGQNPAQWPPNIQAAAEAFRREAPDA